MTIALETVAIFADVQNIYYTTRQAYGRQFDYRAFWQSATANRRLTCAFAYAIDRGDSKQQRFQQVLREIGFTVKLKPFIQRSDGSAKGDWDVGITLDMIETAPAVDVIVLVSGDGDFDLALDRIHTKYGATTEVYGVPSLTATSLARTAKRFVPIDDSFLLSK
jgi:uncharacterized LabA/DUF88 family protein